jgi:hypothetical protein
MTTQDNFYRPDENAHTQQARLTDWTWEAAAVIEWTGKVAELFPQVPVPKWYTTLPPSYRTPQGRIAQVEQVRDLKPHELPIGSKKFVPGACAPARNLFHVSQALSWIAGTRNTIPERLEYVKAIPRLMEPLMEAAA